MGHLTRIASFLTLCWRLKITSSTCQTCHMCRTFPTCGSSVWGACNLMWCPFWALFFPVRSFFCNLFFWIYYFGGWRWPPAHATRATCATRSPLTGQVCETRVTSSGVYFEPRFFLCVRFFYNLFFWIYYFIFWGSKIFIK